MRIFKRNQNAFFAFATILHYKLYCLHKCKIWFIIKVTNQTVYLYQYFCVELMKRIFQMLSLSIHFLRKSHHRPSIRRQMIVACAVCKWFFIFWHSIKVRRTQSRQKSNSHSRCIQLIDWAIRTSRYIEYGICSLSIVWGLDTL